MSRMQRTGQRPCADVSALRRAGHRHHQTTAKGNPDWLGNTSGAGGSGLCHPLVRPAPHLQRPFGSIESNTTLNPSHRERNTGRTDCQEAGVKIKKANRKIVERPEGLKQAKLDDAVLALLSLCINDNEIGSKPGIQANPGFDYETLKRLHAKGYLASPPSILPDRPVWLTPDGARRARELFRELFCD